MTGRGFLPPSPSPSLGPPTPLACEKLQCSLRSLAIEAASPLYQIWLRWPVGIFYCARDIAGFPITWAGGWSSTSLHAHRFFLFSFSYICALCITSYVGVFARMIGRGMWVRISHQFWKKRLDSYRDKSWLNPAWYVATTSIILSYPVVLTRYLRLWNEK